MTLVVALAASLAAAGICALWWVHRAPRIAARAAGQSSRFAAGRAPFHKGANSVVWVRITQIALPAVVIGLLTGWPVASLLAAAAGAFVPRLFGATKSMSAAAKTEAVAAWAEMLRDSLAGAAGLGQAIVVSAPVAPLAIREHVAALASRIDAGVPLANALRQFAEEVDEPGGDLVVAALVLATEQRAQKLGDLLGALAGAAREEVSMRLRVEASRSQVRTSVRVVSGFSIGFAAFLVVVARSYLAPFSTKGGQLVLLAVGVIYAAGLALMLSMARPKPLPRMVLTGRQAP